MSDKERVLALLRLHGWNATSFQILEEGFRYWFDGESACVAYVDTGSAWVVAGAPIAPVDRLGEVAGRFAEAARAARRRVCFFATEQRFSATVPFGTLHVGEQPIWNPASWDATVRKTSSLKEQLRRARAKGVTVRRVQATELAVGSATRTKIEGLIARWLGRRSMAPMGFLVDVQPFTFADERQYFVAEHANAIVGFLAVVPVYARNGWFLEDLLRAPDAPNGTSEALVDAALRRAAELGSTYATLGLAPMAGTSGWLRGVSRWTRALYDFSGVHAFKAKLRPHAWEPIYLSYPKESGPNTALYDALAAFARGSFARFGVQTLLRGPAIVVRLLAVLLIPWTILLMLAGATQFFPSPLVKWSWVGFDIVLAFGLFALASRWRRWLGLTLAAAVTADSILTLVEVLVYNVPRAEGAIDALVLLVAWLAPTFAAVTLWGAVSRSTISSRAMGHATTGLVFAMATISIGASGCSGCDKGSGTAVDGGAPKVVTSDASAVTKPVTSAEDDAGTNDRCVESEAAVVVDKSIRLDAGITLVRLVDGRIAVGWATGEGTPKAAVIDATGKLTPLEVDASGIPELATKPAPKTLRSILRVTPFTPEGSAPKARVAIDLLEVAPDKTRWLRCGAADKKPLFEFKGKSAYDGAADGAAAAEIRDCRTYVDGEHEWAMASELRPTEAADGYEARWLVGARAADPAAPATLMPPIETRKIEAQKDKAPPRADRHVFEVPVASATPDGFVVASRYNGQIVIGRLNASLAPEGKAVGHWLGVPTGTPALATRIDPAGTAASTSLVAAALGKTDLYEVTFPSAPGKPAPMPATVTIAEPPAAGLERTAISAASTNHGNLVVGYAVGTPAKKRARLAILRSPETAPLGPAIDIAEADHVPELRVAALSDGHVLVAWAAQKPGGYALTTAVYRCGPADPLATVLVGDVPGDGGPPPDRD